MKAKSQFDCLCDSCIFSESFPECMPKTVKFGKYLDGLNVIECDVYESSNLKDNID